MSNSKLRIQSFLVRAPDRLNDPFLSEIQKPPYLFFLLFYISCIVTKYFLECHKDVLLNSDGNQFVHLINETILGWPIFPRTQNLMTKKLTENMLSCFLTEDKRHDAYRDKQPKQLCCISALCSILFLCFLYSYKISVKSFDIKTLYLVFSKQHHMSGGFDHKAKSNKNYSKYVFNLIFFLSFKEFGSRNSWFVTSYGTSTLWNDNLCDSAD